MCFEKEDGCQRKVCLIKYTMLKFSLLLFQSIEQRIVEEYRRVRNDATYQAEKSRVNYLHRKLTHIKRMVQHYDQLVSHQVFDS